VLKAIRRLTGFARRPLSVVILLLAVISCMGPDAEELAAIQAAESEAAQDSVENAVAQTLSEINENLERIKERQRLITMNPAEQLSKKQQILDNITLINSLIEDNRRKNELLQMQVGKLRKDKNALSKLVDQSRARIEQQEIEISNLKQELESETFKVTELNQRLEMAAQEVNKLHSESEALSAGNAQLDKSANTGWFVYGTASQLQEKQLVEKAGGILGIGKKDRLTNAFHRNKGVFTAIDTRNVKEIPLYGRKPRLLTDHPANSYKIEADGSEYTKLLIIEPADFWSRTRFLVVEVR
jgi:hypothetical protein